MSRLSTGNSFSPSRRDIYSWNAPSTNGRRRLRPVRRSKRLRERLAKELVSTCTNWRNDAEWAMPRPIRRVELTAEEQETLSAWSRSSAGERRMVERSRVILLAAEGLSAREIARRLNTRQGVLASIR